MMFIMWTIFPGWLMGDVTMKCRNNELLGKLRRRRDYKNNFPGGMKG
jgi:hypothetical protein